MAPSIRVYDELYGYLQLEPPLATIIDTPTFQRLRRIKQLGLASLVYPGAEHSRFSHSLGVAHLTGEILRKAVGSGLVGEDEATLHNPAGLLHDAGHPPRGRNLFILPSFSPARMEGNEK